MITATVEIVLSTEAGADLVLKGELSLLQDDNGRERPRDFEPISAYHDEPREKGVPRRAFDLALLSENDRGRLLELAVLEYHEECERTASDEDEREFDREDLDAVGYDPYDYDLEY